MAFDLIALGLNAVDVLVRLPEHVKRGDKQMVSDLIIQGGTPAGSGACRRPPGREGSRWPGRSSSSTPRCSWRR